MISVIIPTYKNRPLFLKNLAHNRPFLKDAEIIVVNDNPSQSIKHDLENIPGLILIENKKNLGFARSMNIGVRKAKNRAVMLLNSDVLLCNNSYQLAVDDLEKDRSLFAVGFAQKEKDGRIVGRNKISWQKGLLVHQAADSTVDGISAWAEGGACLVDRDKFLKLDGFDPLYSPFYWEDLDLSYRAWKSGYKIVFNARVVVEHHHETTIGKYFPERVIKTTAFRNQFLFVWKNITDRRLFFSHLFRLPANIVYYLLKKEGYFLSGLIAAIGRIYQIRKQSYKISDQAVLDQFLND